MPKNFEGPFFQGKKELKTSKELAQEGKIAWGGGTKKSLEEKQEEKIEKNKEQEVVKKEVEKEEKSSEKRKNFNEILNSIGEEEKQLFYLQKIAELLVVDIKGLEKKEDILKNLEAEFGEEVLVKAFDFVNLKQIHLNIYKDLLEKQRKNKAKSLKELAEEEVRLGKVEYKFFELNNFYNPALISLKEALLEDKYKKLKKEIEEKLAHLSEEEKNKDLLVKMKAYERDFLLPLVNNECLRYQEERLALQAYFNQRSAGFVKKTLHWYSRLPRGLKTATSAFLFGGVVAAFVPSLVATAIPTYLAYRALRGFVGGTLAGILQKTFGEKLIEKSRMRDEQKAVQNLKEAVEGKKDFELIKNNYFGLGEIGGFLIRIFSKEKREKWLAERKERGEKEKELITDINEELKKMDEYLMSKDFKRVAELNLKISEANLITWKNLEASKKLNTAAMVFATGLIGGVLGANLVDYLSGGGFVQATEKTLEKKQTFESSQNEYEYPHKPKTLFVEDSTQETAEEPKEEFINSKKLELATIKKGEGVEHAFKRQLMAEPEKFGFKGDLNNPEELNKWAQIKAHQIAIEKGYISKDGIEVRVFHYGLGRNPAYLLDLDENNQLEVIEVFENKIRPTGSLNEYEYLYKPKTLFVEDSTKLEKQELISPSSEEKPVLNQETAQEVQETTVQEAQEKAQETAQKETQQQEEVIKLKEELDSTKKELNSTKKELYLLKEFQKLKPQIDEFIKKFENDYTKFLKFPLWDQENIFRHYSELYDYFDDFKEAMDEDLLEKFNSIEEKIADMKSNLIRNNAIFSSWVKERFFLTSTGVDLNEFLNTPLEDFVERYGNNYSVYRAFINFWTSSEIHHSLKTVGDVLKYNFWVKYNK